MRPAFQEVIKKDLIPISTSVFQDTNNSENQKHLKKIKFRKIMNKSN